jgi:hypothetical protein
LGVDNDLIITKAYLQCDIIWENLGKSPVYAIVKRSALFLALFVISLMILTPTYAFEFLTPLYNSIIHRFQDDEMVSSYIKAYFEPCIELMINFVFIPFLIDFSCQYEDFRRKSSRQISIMRRIYIFMFINTLLLPLSANIVI